MAKAKFRLPKVVLYTDNTKKVWAVTSFRGRKIKAVAKCAPEDTFDFEVGAKLATERLYEKFFKAKLNRLFELISDYNVLIGELSESRGKLHTAVTETVSGYADYLGKTTDDTLSLLTE